MAPGVESGVVSRNFSFPLGVRNGLTVLVAILTGENGLKGAGTLDSSGLAFGYGLLWEA